MLPKWFEKWNEENPTNIFGPAILVGVLGAAVFFAIAVISIGNPAQTTSMQTGPRGTGMHVAEFNVVRFAADPTIEDYYTEEPYIPEGGEDIARDIYENVQVLGDLTEDNFNRVMTAMTQWVAPEEGCAYCHGDVDLEEYGNDDLYTKVVARRMIQMTQNINEGWDGHVNVNKEVGVTCYTCHRGQNVPSDIWFKMGSVNEAAGGWAAVQNRVTVQSQYTSLPSDALETFLLDYGRIGVHDLEAHVAAYPSEEGYPTWQDTERTFSLMNYVSNSLGVNCVFCHNSRAFYDPGQVTLQWSTASLGILMVQDIIEQHLLPLGDVYPEERLGPVFGDAPLAACRTCHQGQQRPMRGMNVIVNYPELATTSGEPDYSAFQ